jgi:hypothetical protein
VRKLAVFLSGLCVILRFLVLAHRVVVLSLVMVMRGGVVVTGRVMVMFSRRMFCHLSVLPLRRMRPDRKRVPNSSPARFAPAGPDQVSSKTDTGGKAFVTAARGSDLLRRWRGPGAVFPALCRGLVFSTQRRKPGFPFVPDLTPGRRNLILCDGARSLARLADPARLYGGVIPPA